ncbi:MAG: type VI secretion system baseplate subunit TssG, partial [Brucella intermedia]
METVPPRIIARLKQSISDFEPTTAYHVAEIASEVRSIIHTNCDADLSPSPVQLIAQPNGQVDLQVEFAALSGPVGCLPPHIDEMLREQSRQKSFALRSFLEIFNSRLAGLFVAACDKYRSARTIRWSRSTKRPIETVLFSLMGILEPHFRRNIEVNRHLLLHYAGI